jgi:hypothetical protein
MCHSTEKYNNILQDVWYLARQVVTENVLGWHVAKNSSFGKTYITWQLSHSILHVVY